MAQESADTDFDVGTAQAEATEAPSPGATEGTSSSDVTAESPQTARDAMLAAFEEPKPEEPAAATPEPEPAAEATKAPETTTDSSDDETFRLSDTEFSGLSQGARQRIGYLSTTLAKTRKEIEAARPVVERMDQLEGFLRDNNLGADDVTTALGALAKARTGDPKGALSILEPLVNQLRQAAGMAYADDLAPQIENGELSEGAAMRLTQERIRAQQLAEQNRALQQQQASFAAAQRHNALRHSVVSAINARQVELSREPDWPLIHASVAANLKLATDNGVSIGSEAQAVQLLNRVVEHVRANLPKSAAQPTAPTPASIATPPRAQPVPRSAREAMLLAARGV